MTKATEPDKPNNLTLWEAVSKTNPAFTKKVNQRGGFTAIAAHSQIMEATRQFGPIGIGWGYDTGEPIFRENLIIIPVTIWHTIRSMTFGPLYGAAELVNDKGRTDHDAPKKATTDALTKGLSQIGFNADVFLGLFDDNKYIEQMKKDFGPEVEHGATGERKPPVKLLGLHKTVAALREALAGIKAEVEGAADRDALDTYLDTQRETLTQCRDEKPDWWENNDYGMDGIIRKAYERIELEEDNAHASGVIDYTRAG